MGIYLFNRSVLEACLAGNQEDFGKHIIPEAIKDRRVQAHVFQGYWEDIGTIRRFSKPTWTWPKSSPRSASTARAPAFTRDHAFCPPAKSTAQPSTEP